MAEESYFVIGGEYSDTTFTRLAEGRTLESYGPFPEKAALERWRALSARAADQALVRYRLKPAGVTSDQMWYVAGGEYRDTSFSAMAGGQRLESYGPYGHAEALAVWRALTSKTEDRALARYDIVTLEGLEEIRRTA